MQVSAPTLLRKHRLRARNGGWWRTFQAEFQLKSSEAERWHVPQKVLSSPAENRFGLRIRFRASSRWPAAAASRWGPPGPWQASQRTPGSVMPISELPETDTGPV